MSMSALCRYKADHGDNNLPRKPELREWAAQQHKQSSMNEQCKTAMDNLGFLWIVRPWMLNENRQNNGDYISLASSDDWGRDDRNLMNRCYVVNLIHAVAIAKIFTEHCLH
jgi:hypothetical protein